jgi:ABC-type phosphate transport system substrate-binding protein
MNRNRIGSLLVAAAALMGMPAAAEVVVIVSAKNPVASLSAEQVAQIYLGRAGSFPGGGAATPLDIKEGVALRDEFYAKVTDKNPGQVKSYWSKQMFSGKGSPPRELASAAEVRRAVAADPGAIGYIDRGALDGSVKEVLVVR